MAAIKVNLYISCADEDRAHLLKLLKWLYPMNDEVNVWFRNPPSRLPSLSLPWRILLFWYRPPELLSAYEKVWQNQLHRAHIYLFLTSHKSLNDRVVDEEITIAVNRRVEGDWRSPRIFPVVVSASKWQEKSRLANYESLGPPEPLNQVKPETAGWHELTTQISEHVRFVQSVLNEVRFYRNRPVIADEHPVTYAETADPVPLPDLGDDPAAVTFVVPGVSYPPEWLGWAIIVFLFFGVFKGLQEVDEFVPKRLYRNANERPAEYIREFPMMPPPDSVKPFPPDEDAR